jgi:hypothetical protein
MKGIDEAGEAVPFARVPAKLPLGWKKRIAKTRDQGNSIFSPNTSRT